ncbi:hypothetical protein CRUP_033991, partial [Coryphaenoides rupestris]
MDSLLPAEPEAPERGSGTEERRRRIQFTVPPPSTAPVQLDPRQVEM